MALLAAEQAQRTRQRGAGEYTVNGTDVVFGGALVGMTNIGTVTGWVDPSVPTLTFEGIAVQPDFDTAAGEHQVTGPNKISVNTEGLVLMNVAVAGSPTVPGVKVYSATDNVADLSITATPGGSAIGRLIKANGSNWDVRLYTPEESRRN